MRTGRADAALTPPLSLPALGAALREQAARAGAGFREHPLRHACGDYTLWRIASPAVAAGAPVLLVRAGIHGDETSGPLTFARHLAALVERANHRGVGLLVYPLGNPSGYQHGVRYNGDHDAGDEGNNDFLRYHLADGRIAGALPSTETAFSAWQWSDEPSLGVSLPAETRLMQTLLRAEPVTRVRAVLDLHQDHLSAGAGAGAYHYAFGDLGRYEPIVERIARRLPLLAEVAIGAGFGTAIDAHGAVCADGGDGHAAPSDTRGFIVRHDGTLTDLAWRLGVPHAVAPETTGATAMDDAIEVNLAWIEGLMDLLAAG